VIGDDDSWEYTSLRASKDYVKNPDEGVLRATYLLVLQSPSVITNLHTPKFLVRYSRLFGTAGKILSFSM
jgi:hypothetical protein